MQAAEESVDNGVSKLRSFQKLAPVPESVFAGNTVLFYEPLAPPVVRVRHCGEPQEIGRSFKSVPRFNSPRSPAPKSAILTGPSGFDI